MAAFDRAHRPRLALPRRPPHPRARRHAHDVFALSVAGALVTALHAGCGGDGPPPREPRTDAVEPTSQGGDSTAAARAPAAQPPSVDVPPPALDRAAAATIAAPPGAAAPDAAPPGAAARRGVDGRVLTRALLAEEGEHAARLRASWQRWEEAVGAPLQQWGATALPEPDPRGPAALAATAFYPFSGPDFPTVHRLYPDANHYVLIAMQRAQRPPELGDDDALPAALRAGYREVIAQYAARGFFVTKEMNAGYGKRQAIEGLSGLLALFAALEGFEVVELVPVALDRTPGAAPGALVELDPAEGPWDSVRLRLRAADGRPVTLDYVRLNLADRGLRASPTALAFVEHFAGARTMVKAASHLMQSGTFNAVRDALLARTPLLVQDETGISYRSLTAGFAVELHGDYATANELFDQRPQPELRAAYGALESAGIQRPLPFRFGYAKRRGPCLQVAVPREPGAANRSGDRSPPANSRPLIDPAAVGRP